MYQIITTVFVLIFSAQLSATAMTGVFNSNNASSNNDSRSGAVFGKSSGHSGTTTTSQSSSGESSAVFGKSHSSSGGSSDGDSTGSSDNKSSASKVFGTNNRGSGRGFAQRARGEADPDNNNSSANPEKDNSVAEKEQRAAANEQEDKNPRSAPNYRWPVEGGRINSFYGWRSSRRFHDGIDIVAPSGTNVFASKSGEVIYSGNRIRGYGNMIVIRHNGGYSTVYAHNKTNLVSKGDIVKQGDIISHVGSTGHSSGPHLHFEVRKGKYSADPLKYLRDSDVKRHSGAYANSSDNPF